MRQDTKDARTRNVKCVPAERTAPDICCCTDKGTRTEDRHAGTRQEEIRKVGSKAKRQEIVLKAFIVTNHPVSATKPNRGPCHAASCIHILLHTNSRHFFILCVHSQCPPPRHTICTTLLEIPSSQNVPSGYRRQTSRSFGNEKKQQKTLAQGRRCSGAIEVSPHK